MRWRMRWEDRRLKRDSGEGFGGRGWVGWGNRGIACRRNGCTYRCGLVWVEVLIEGVIDVDLKL